MKNGPNPFPLEPCLSLDVRDRLWREVESLPVGYGIDDHTGNAVIQILGDQREFHKNLSLLLAYIPANTLEAFRQECITQRQRLAERILVLRNRLQSLCRRSERFDGSQLARMSIAIGISYFQTEEKMEEVRTKLSELLGDFFFYDRMVEHLTNHRLKAAA